MSTDSRNRLCNLRDELVSLVPYPWQQIEAWSAKALPIIRRDCPDDLDDFRHLVAAPSFIPIPVALRGNEETNRAAMLQARETQKSVNIARCEQAKARIVSFLAGLLSATDLSEPSEYALSDEHVPVAIKQQLPDNHPTAVADPRKVFVVYGRNQAARDAMFTFLRATGLHPLEWAEIVQQTGEASPYVGEVLKVGFSIVQAVVVLLTPDDEARLRQPYRVANDPEDETELTPQPRPNVLLEAGMALGLFPERTVIVELGRLRPISDIHGRHVIRLDNSPQQRQALAQRLKTAGCAVNLSGTDWLTSGSFDIATADCDSVPAEPVASVETEADVLAGYNLSSEARTLLVAAAAAHGQVLHTRSSSGRNTQAGHQTFNEPHNQRSEATWEQAIKDLVACGLLIERGYKGQVFEVTAKGYEVADVLQKREGA